MYDLIVIGGGPAGGNAAERAAEKGLSVALFEERFMGGVCLNEGCIPSKALLHCAKLYSHAKHSASFGVVAQNVSFDWKTAMARKNDVVAKIRKASESSKKKRKIPVVNGHAEVLPAENGIFRVKSGETIHEAKRLLLCNGSEAVRVPIPGVNQNFVYTNREMLDIDHIPANLVIIGGGIIGLEFATLFSEVGSKVTVIEMLPGIAGALDDDIRTLLHKSLENKGITFELRAAVTEIGDHQILFKDAQGQEKSVPADIVLVSAGRRPRSAGCGLENLHLAMDRAAVKTDEQGRTSVPNVFAAGDINGVSMLAHTASREADVCIDTILGIKNRVRYDRIPGVIYTHPEVATVGLTLPQAQERGIDAAETSMPMAYSGRYLVETENGRGVVKVVTERTHGTILGVHMFGGECSEMIHGAVAMIEAELRIKDIRDMVFAHPTVAEVMRDSIVGTFSH